MAATIYSKTPIWTEMFKPISSEMLTEASVMFFHHPRLFKACQSVGWQINQQLIVFISIGSW